MQNVEIENKLYPCCAAVPFFTLFHIVFHCFTVSLFLYIVSYCVSLFIGVPSSPFQVSSVVNSQQGKICIFSWMWIVNSFELGIRALCHMNTNELARIQGEKCKHWTVPNLVQLTPFEFGHSSFYLEWKNHSWWRAWVDFILFKLKTQFEFMTCNWVAHK